jgi:hypothetical protein
MWIRKRRKSLMRSFIPLVTGSNVERCSACMLFGAKCFEIFVGVLVTITFVTHFSLCNPNLEMLL